MDFLNIPIIDRFLSHSIPDYSTHLTVEEISTMFWFCHTLLIERYIEISMKYHPMGCSTLLCDTLNILQQQQV
jgi:hypothetical protein